MKHILSISRSKSLKEHPYKALEESIFTSPLEKGKLHNEKKLAKVLGISGTPVPEAHLELSRKAEVHLIPGKEMNLGASPQLE